MQNSSDVNAVSKHIEQDPYAFTEKGLKQAGFARLFTIVYTYNQHLTAIKDSYNTEPKTKGNNSKTQYFLTFLILQ